VVPRIVAMAVAARFRAVAGGDDRSGESDQPENANSQVREEAKVVRSIYFPVPISILITGS
jgi:hypothetical protein